MLGKHRQTGATRAQGLGGQGHAQRIINGELVGIRQLGNQPGVDSVQTEAPRKAPLICVYGHECLEMPRWQHVLCLLSDIQ